MSLINSLYAPAPVPFQTSANISTSANQNAEQFDFGHAIGADESVKDTAKMSILLSFQPEYGTFYEKSKIIQKKFEEKYGGEWRVITFKKNCGGSFGHYKSIYLYIHYKDYTFIIFNN